ncbi:MAG: UvrB/UvrC motif-containing protein [Clostridia bacterium]
MLCQRCSQNPAAIHVQRNINGKRTQIHLCQSCYKDLGGTSSSDFGWPTLLGGIDGLQTAMGLPEAKKAPKCDHCGLTYEKFIAGGKFGCSNCYGEFNDKLELMFKRLHGSASHQGRIPGSPKKQMKKPATSSPAKTKEKKPRVEEVLADLKLQLAKAVKEEDYPLAATLRDQIIALEKRGGDTHDQ